jgi:hypothetical protein
MQLHDCYETGPDEFNHFRVLVNQNRLEVWSTDAQPHPHTGVPTPRKMATFDNLGLTFTRGFVHWQHATYNPGSGVSQSQTYHWDNMGFDGPVLPTPAQYSIPDSLTNGVWPGAVNTGYPVGSNGLVGGPKTFTNVNLGGATAATLTFSQSVLGSSRGINYRFNNGPWHAWTSPYNTTGIAAVVPVTLSELRPGNNTIDFMPLNGSTDAIVISNIDLIMAGVSGTSVGQNPPTATPGQPTATPTRTPTSSPAQATATPTTPPSQPTATPTSGSQPPPSSSTATFVGQDSTTRGTWKGVYGAQGHWLHADARSLPTYAQILVSGGSDHTWDSSTSDTRALQKAGSTTDRIASSWYKPDVFAVDVNLTDGQPHKVSIYALDWDSTERIEKVEVLDATTFAVLDTRIIGGFNNGTYLSWILQGHTQLRVTRLSGDNAVLSAIFIEPAPDSTSATFVGQDTATGGNWKGKYGAQGIWLQGDARNMPGFVLSSVTDALNYMWAASTSDPRALSKAGSSTDRVAAAWYNAGSFVANVHLTDGVLHKISLYAVDWDSDDRVEKIEIVEVGTGKVLDSRTVSNFNGGVYLSWNVTGNVQIRVSRTSGDNAVVSGLFIDQ